MPSQDHGTIGGNGPPDYLEPGAAGSALPEELRQRELLEIARRREAAGLGSADGGDDPAAGPPADLVGLALSGGGVRSASFNLGVLQALHHYGLIRHVDYLATVSGGSYIGARFCSEVQALDGNLGRDNLPLRARPRGRQSPLVKRMLRAGHYLSHVLPLANRYFIGVAKIDLAIGSLVLTACVLLALTWRFLDETPVNELIVMLTGGTLYEVVRPFLFTFVFLLAWVLGWGLSGMDAARREKYWFAGTAVELGLCALVLGWYHLEATRAVDLYPDHLLWVFARPLPFLLVFAWPLAWLVTSAGPRAPGGAGKPWRHLGLWLLVGVLGTLAFFLTGRPAPAGPLGPGLDALYVWAFLALVAWALFARAARPGRPPNLRILVGVPVVLGVAALVWRLLEVAGVAGLRGEEFWWLVLRPAPFLLLILWVVACLLVSWRSEAPRLDVGARLRWLLLLAGASLLVGWAVWGATPSVSLVAPTKSSPFGEGRTELARSLSQPLLALLLAALIPLLRPRRLLQGWLRPTHFWEPWVFYVVCTAVLVGIPLFGVWFFARHNISGHNAERADRLLPHDLGEHLWRQAIKEADRPGADRNPTPAAWVWQNLGEDDRAKVREFLRHKTPGRPNPLSPRDFGAVQFEITDRVNHLVFDDPTRLQRLPAFQAFAANPEGGGDAGEALRRLLAQKERYGEGDDTRALDRRINRLFLEVSYPEGVSSHTLVRRSPLILHDQAARFCWLLVFLLVFVGCAALLRINGTSLHQFYRDQLARVYIRPRPGHEPGDHGYPLAEIGGAVRKGGPYPLICATFNPFSLYDLIRRLLWTAESPDRAARIHGAAVQGAGPAAANPEVAAAVAEAAAASVGPPGVGAGGAAPPASPGAPGGQGPTDTFIFSPLYCGCGRTGYCPTGRYEYEGEPLSLSEVAALSGAAFSPAQSGSPLSLFMAVLNLRLGQWLPSPRPRPPWHQPKIMDLLFDGQRPLDRREYFFISDGGHHENLGLGVLLQRRCRLIVVSDATADPEYNFDDFLRLCRRERLDHGVRFREVVRARDGRTEEIHLDVVRPRAYRADSEDRERPERTSAGWLSEDWRSEQHFFVARIDYPGEGGEGPGRDAPPAYLVYLKPSLTGDEENDLKRHWSRHPAFPHDPTSNQFYDEDMVESYRQLGYHIGEEFCTSLLRAGRIGGDLWSGLPAPPPPPGHGGAAIKDIHDLVGRWWVPKLWRARQRAQEKGVRRRRKRARRPQRDPGKVPEPPDPEEESGFPDLLSGR